MPGRTMPGRRRRRVLPSWVDRPGPGPGPVRCQRLKRAGAGAGRRPGLRTILLQLLRLVLVTTSRERRGIAGPVTDSEIDMYADIHGYF